VAKECASSSSLRHVCGIRVLGGILQISKRRTFKVSWVEIKVAHASSTPNFPHQVLIFLFAMNAIPNLQLPDPINEIRAVAICRICQSLANGSLSYPQG
jgi:hypothetical protein